MSTTVRRAGIYKLQLSHRSGNDLVFDLGKDVAKLCKHFSNERKTFSKSRQKAGNLEPLKYLDSRWPN